MIFVNSNSQFRKSCAACIRARAACDHSRPCSRCVSLRCTDKCVDVERKRRTKKPKTEAPPSNSQPPSSSSSSSSSASFSASSSSHPHISPPASSSLPPASSLSPSSTLPPSSTIPPPHPPSLPSSSSSSSSVPFTSQTLPPLCGMPPPPNFPPPSPLSSRSMRSPPPNPLSSSSNITFSSTGTPDISVTSPPLPNSFSVTSPPLPSSCTFYNYDINLPSITNLDNSFPINESLLDFNASTGSPKPRAQEQSNSEENNNNNNNNSTSSSSSSSSSPQAQSDPPVSSPTPTPPPPPSPSLSNNSVVEASEYTFTCHRLPDYVSDLLSTYLALQKLSLAHRSTSPISISFDAKCEPFDPQPVIMLHKTTLGIVDCNLPFANFIGYNTVSEFMDEKSNFTDVITPNGVSMSKRTYQHFLNTSIHKFERLELMKTKHAGTKAVTIQSHITERHTIITLTEFFHDLPMCFLAPFIKRCLPNIQLAPCRRTHCQCVYADLFY